MRSLLEQKELRKLPARNLYLAKNNQHYIYFFVRKFLLIHCDLCLGSAQEQIWHKQDLRKLDHLIIYSVW